MTKPDAAPNDDLLARSYWTHLLVWSVVFTFVLLAAGLSDTWIYRAASGGEVVAFALAIALIVAVAGGYAALQTSPDWTMGEPKTPRSKRIRWLIAALVLVGLAVALLVITGDPEPGGKILWRNGPVPQTSALLAVSIWVLAMPLIIVAGYTTADEHANEAQVSGMAVGFQAFAYAAPIWWMGWRGGFFPQPDVMILFIATGGVSTVANLLKRYA